MPSPFLVGLGLLASSASTNTSTRASSVARRADDCAQPFGACTESKCCSAEPTFGCFKRHGRPFAQCRRVPAEGCKADETWQCPTTWEECTTPSYQNCWDTGCCADGNMACLRRGTRHFAQCRPVKDCEAEGSEWICPGKWTAPVLNAAPPPPAECTAPFQTCTNTHCCEGKAFKCIEKKNKFFAQCIRPESYSSPSPPTEAPTPDDAMTPAPEVTKKSKGGPAKNGKAKSKVEKESLVDDVDEDEDEDEEAASRKKKASKPKSKPKRTSSRPDDDDVDGFD